MNRYASLSTLATVLATLAPLLVAHPAGAQAPAAELRRKTTAAAALKKGLELRARACKELSRSQSLDANQPRVALRLADCKRLGGELSRAEALVARAVALTTAKGPARRAVDEPRAASLARIAEGFLEQACAQFSQSQRDDITVEAALQVATCQIAAGQLGESRAMLTAVMSTLPAQPPPVVKRMQPVIGSLLAELDRLQPYLTVVAPAGSSDTFTIDGAPAVSGQPMALEPGAHTVVARAAGAKPGAGNAAGAKPGAGSSRSFVVVLQLSERRIMSLAVEQDKLASAEFGAGTDLLVQACRDIERVARSPAAGAPALARLAMCKRLFGEHAAADELWNTSDAMIAGNVAPPANAATAAVLRTADEALRQACARFQASLELDLDMATELAVAGCQLRESQLRPARARLERALAPPSPLAAPADELGRTQAELARALLGDVDRLQPKLRVEPATGFRGAITVNGVAIAPNTAISMDPGRYIVLQVPARGPRVVHEVILAERDRVVLKHNLRCNGLGMKCVNPEQRVSAPSSASSKLE